MCPRLARARDQWVAFENARVEAVGYARADIFRLERLVAHRDLQVMRAVAACGRAKSTRARRSAGQYLVDRQDKLSDAQKALVRAQKRLSRLQAPVRG